MIAGITWAVICLILIIFLFLGYNNLSVAMSKLPFMKINPNYSGGEVQRRYVSANCTIDIRKPVFNGLIKEKKRGFVQIDWTGKLPETLRDTIDYDADNKPDFIIAVNTADSKTTLIPLNPKVETIQISSRTSRGWAARIRLMK